MLLRRSLGSGLIIGLVVAGSVQACSAGDKGGGKSNQNQFGNGGTPSNGGAPAAGGMTANGGSVFPNTGASPNFGGQLPTSSGGGRNDDECGRLVQPAEIVYIDASYTDTIVSYSPIALYVMIDRSSSMVGITGDPLSWQNAQGALTAFVQDPASAGIDIGLAAFPPMSNTAAPDCGGGADCGTAIVPIASLPNNSGAMTTALQQATPPIFPILTTPTECGLRGMINGCVAYSQQAMNEQCVAILVTDGAPSQCDLNTQNLINIVADGKNKGVKTFTLGLPGANQAFLDQLAQAGGTNASIPITGGAAGQQAFLAALNNIRGTVSHSETKQIRRAISAPLPCQFNIPPPQDGKPFDKNKTNVEFTPSAGAAAQSFLNVPTVNDCANGTTQWYYDTPANPGDDPKQVLLCPSTCDMVKATTGASVNIVFGCEIKRVN